MEQKTLGIVLNYYRNKKGYPMEKVCAGLCSVSTLFRIEQGERVADSLLGSLLLERMGCEINQFELLLDNKDYTLWSLREKIKRLIFEKKYDDAERKLEKYFLLEKKDSKLHEQFYYICKLKIKLEKEKNTSEEYVTKEEGFILTKKIFCMTREAKENKIFCMDELYTKTEIELMIILLGFSEKKSLNEKQHELQCLLKYTEHMFSGCMKKEVSLLLLKQLVEVSKIMKEIETVLMYLNYGINILSEGRYIENLDEFHFQKAEVLYDMGHLETDENKQEIKMECLMAYSICEIMSREEYKHKIENFCRENLQWDITKLEM